MKPSILSLTATMVMVACTLSASSISSAHSSNYHSGHKHRYAYHHLHRANSYILINRSNLARDYFNYRYERRRAQKMVRYYSREHRHYYPYEPYNNYYTYPDR